MGKKLQIKITLRGSKPPIWRRVLINDSINFEEFHLIIQNTMGWWNSHLYEFKIGGMNFGVPFDDFLGETNDSSKYRVKDYLKQKGDKAIYTYDFGDSWEHQITVEKTETLKKGEKLPVCIKGKRNCPPEDCGGIWGYADMLETIRDKKNPEYEDMMEWLGGDFDPEEFDIDLINKELE